jgi:hypothetical protein
VGLLEKTADLGLRCFEIAVGDDSILRKAVVEVFVQDY